jgi:hypothetical protein
MASIKFLLNGGEVVFEDVKEELAKWLVNAMTAYHGLLPNSVSLTIPAPAPINKVEEVLPPVPPDPSKRVKLADVASRSSKRADLAMPVDTPDGKGD